MSSERKPEDQTVESRFRDMIDHAREQVEALHVDQGTTIHSPAQGQEHQAAAARAAPLPDSFSGYDLTKEIHRGGQGVVYQAIQKNTKRKVAIKVMREGPFAGTRDKARFDREIQILGQLNHPSIVGIHDSGMAAGCSYFVMDYISGQPLDGYMAGAERPIEQTLRLFAKICEAINAAHLRGVIHRDLKPGNIRIDADGEPHVLDFGLAKTVMGEATDGSHAQVMTETGQFVGSLPWASPEQAEGQPGKIDVRTDVYSLGVILYQMLTGRFPYEVAGAMREVLENILRADPVRPRSIRRQIDDEVETIVLKCLGKERERRYQSAGELGRDIRHYLAGEPIEAKRDSSLYVLRKSLKRHRLKIALGAIVLAAAASVGVLELSHRVERRNAVLRRDADLRIRQAEQLIGQRRELDTARRFLNEAVKILDRAVLGGPDIERAYLRLGTITTLQALEAPLQKKPALTDQAIAVFHSAHLAAGGSPVIGSEAVPESAASRRGSPAALRAMADLTLVNDWKGGSSQWTSLATEAGRLLRTARALDDELGTLTSSLNALQLGYDRQRDPLRVDRLPESSPRDAGQVPDLKAEIRWVLSRRLTSLNPQGRLELEEQYFTNLIFDRLFEVDESNQFIPNPVLVSSAEPSADGRAWTIQLNPQSRWHDGESVTAADVKFSWPEQSGETEGQGSISIQAKGLHTVRIVASTGRIEPWDMDFCLLPSHRYSPESAGDSLSESTRDELRRRPIGCGPYRIEGDGQSNSFVLRRWEDYPGAEEHGVYLDAIAVEVVEDREERVRRLADGKADVLELKPDEFRWHVNGASFSPDRVVKVMREKYHYDYLCWNLYDEASLFRNVEVRRALTHALDLNGMRESLYSDLFNPCYGIFQGHPFSTRSAADLLAFDPARSEVLLDQAGWRRDPRRGNLRYKNGEPFQFKLLVPDAAATKGPTFSVVALQIQEQLARIGVGVDLDPQPWSVCQSRMGGHTFEACVGGVVPCKHPLLDKDRWTLDGMPNYGCYNNGQVRDWFEKAKVAREEKNSHSELVCYREIETQIYSDQPYTFLWQKSSLWTFSKRLRGVKFSRFGPTLFYPGPRSWWVALRD